MTEEIIANCKMEKRILMLLLALPMVGHSQVQTVRGTLRPNYTGGYDFEMSVRERERSSIQIPPSLVTPATPVVTPESVNAMNNAFYNGYRQADEVQQRIKAQRLARARESELARAREEIAAMKRDLEMQRRDQEVQIRRMQQAAQVAEERMRKQKEAETHKLGSETVAQQKPSAATTQRIDKKSDLLPCYSYP